MQKTKLIKMQTDEYKEVNKIDLAKHLYKKLNAQLENEGRTIKELRTEKKKWLVAWRTLHYLSKGELVLRPKKITELCKLLGIPFTHEVKYFIKN